MELKALLIGGMLIGGIPQLISAQRDHQVREPLTCGPCTIQLDTVVIMKPTESITIKGTSLFERVGAHYVLADLIESTYLSVFDSLGTPVSKGPEGRIRQLKFGDIKALSRVSDDSIMVFDEAQRKIVVVSISSGGAREVPLPSGVSPGGGLTQGEFTIVVPSPSEASGITVRGTGHTVALDVLETGNNAEEVHPFSHFRLLGHGTTRTAWVLHFLSYTLHQFDLETGERLRSLSREPDWLLDSEVDDWRYPSLLAAHQLSPNLLWVLGRSLDPTYVLEPEGEGPPLAGRELAWDLELELVSVTTGALVGSLTLPYWIGGFTSGGLFFFFDEESSDQGHIVVTRPRLVQDAGDSQDTGSEA